MHIKIYEDHQALSEKVAAFILDLVRKNSRAVLCLAAGHTPELSYQLVAEWAVKENIDFSGCTFIGLDEWVGIPPSTEGSCHYFLHTTLFQPLAIEPEQVHLFNSMSADLQADCSRMDELIASKNGIDLMLVGLGMNGHIGFNEPGVSANLYSHVIDLDSDTQSVGQKYFGRPMVLKQGITLGLRNVLESKTLIMMASGSKKAGIISEAIHGALHNEVPASLLRTHSRGWVMLDAAAASLVQLEQLPGDFVLDEP